MKIIIASTVVPFIEGGGTFIVDWLEEKLREYGHQVDCVKIPFSSHYKEMLPQMLALRFYHLEDYCDRLICIRMPSYLLKHAEKYLWFIHHYREVYDLWNTSLDFYPRDPEALSIREFIKRADDKALKEAKKIYTNSQIVSNRLKRFNNIIANPVYPPVYNSNQFYCDSYGDFIYYPSRICQPKRQLLAIEAMRHTRTPVKLLITGKSEQDLYLKEIVKCIKEYKLESSVTVINRFITEEEKIAYFAQCLACAYIPYDEDSYGYPSLEAYHSKKSVISCTDSGGVDELIINGKNGFLLESTPQKLAEAFDQLYEDRALAQNMGENGGRRIHELNITWDNVIRRFTS